MAKETSKLTHIEPGSEEMDKFLSVGYGDMNAEKAKQIIAEREKNPALWPYREFQRAKAYLAALTAKPVAVSSRKGSTLK